MSTPLIKTKNIYFQRTFSKSSEERISAFFNFSDDETLLCGLWTKAFSRFGFVISNKAIYWYLKTSDGVKSGGIIKQENMEFQISPYIYSGNTAASIENSIAEECSRLEIRSPEKNESFYLTGLTEEKGKTLCDILRFAFLQEKLPQIDLGKLVKTPAFTLFRTFCDEILNTSDDILKKVCRFKNSFHRKYHNEKSKSDENAEGSEKSVSENIEKKENSSALRGSFTMFLLNFLDACASLFYIMTLVVVLKSNMFVENDFLNVHFSKIAFAGFTVLKCSVAFYSKNGTRKIIAIILVVISLLSNILFSYGLVVNQNGSEILIIVSSILCLLSYFAFEVLCEFTGRAVLKKICFVIITGFSAYIMIRLSLYSRLDCLKYSALSFWNEICCFCATL